MSITRIKDEKPFKNISEWLWDEPKDIVLDPTDIEKNPLSPRFRKPKTKEITELHLDGNNLQTVLLETHNPYGTINQIIDEFNSRVPELEQRVGKIESDMDIINERLTRIESQVNSTTKKLNQINKKIPVHCTLPDGTVTQLASQACLILGGTPQGEESSTDTQKGGIIKSTSSKKLQRGGFTKPTGGRDCPDECCEGESLRDAGIWNGECVPNDFPNVYPSTQQASYYFESVQLVGNYQVHGTDIENDDWVVGYCTHNGVDTLVGGHRWNRDDCADYICEVVLYGDMGTASTEGYCNCDGGTCDVPTFKIWNQDTDQYCDAVSSGVEGSVLVSETIAPWDPGVSSTYRNLSGGCGCATHACYESSNCIVGENGLGPWPGAATGWGCLNNCCQAIYPGPGPGDNIPGAGQWKNPKEGPPVRQKGGRTTPKPLSKAERNKLVNSILRDQ